MTGRALEEEWSAAGQLPEQDVEAFLSLIECGICQAVLSEPLETPCCAALFCAACLGPWVAARPSCPLCRASVVPGSARPARSVARLLARLAAPCPHAGCQAAVARADLAAHAAACDMAPARRRRRQAETQTALRLRLDGAGRLATPEELARLAEELQQAGMMAEALSVVARAPQGCARIAAVKSDLLFSSGDFRAALSCCPPDQLDRKAECHIKLGEYAPAEALLEKLLAETNGTNATALCLLGNLKKKTSEYQAAIGYLVSRSFPHRSFF